MCLVSFLYAGINRDVEQNVSWSIDSQEEQKPDLNVKQQVVLGVILVEPLCMDFENREFVQK